MESIKKKYYKLSSKEFNKYIDSIKNDSETIVLFKKLDKQYYFKMDNELYNALLDLHLKQKEFDLLINSFSDFAQKQIIQSYLIDEILSTNQIESIISTKHDIFYLINDGLNIKDKKTQSITKTYSILLNEKYKKIDSLKIIREIYDLLMKDCLDKNDYPDGKYFRKSEVFINDGIKNIHQGFYPEEKINIGMKEFINIYNDTNIDIYIRLALSHFIFEIVHPYYDGNGRMGRFLLSNLLYNNENTYSAFLLSKSIKERKKDYYRILQDSKDDREMNILNYYVLVFLDILKQGLQEAIDDLKFQKEEIESYKLNNSYSKSESKIISLLKEATLLSNYGVTINEIIFNTSLSKRTIAYTIKKLKDKDYLEINRIGKNNYYKYKENLAI